MNWICIAAVSALVFVDVLIGGWYIATRKNETYPPPSNAASADIFAYWDEMIVKEGAEKAYAMFKRATAQYPPKRQHEAAHAIGVALYNREGVRGVAVCDSAFKSGCYHGFFGKALSMQGMGAIAEFDRACRERHGASYSPCQHGIGHGSMYAIGEEDLAAGMATCEPIQDGPLHGCFGGVVMEYNTRVMIDPSGSALRSVQNGDIYWPCAEIPARFQPACYYGLPQWWNAMGKESVLLCGAVEHIENRQACFYGLGNEAGGSSRSALVAVQEVCDGAPTFADMIDCRQGVLWTDIPSMEREDFKERVCVDFPMPIRDQCRKQLQ